MTSSLPPSVEGFFYVMMSLEYQWQGFWIQACDLKKAYNERETGS